MKLALGLCQRRAEHPGVTESLEFCVFPGRSGQGQRVTIKVVAALDIGLLAAALCDLAHRKPDEVRGSRAMWTALSFVDFIGPISYFTIGRKGGCCFCCEEKTEDSPDTLEETDTVSE